MDFHVQNSQGIALPLTVLTLCVPGIAVAQETPVSRQTVRHHVEQTCGTQLAAYETALGEGPSFWQLQGATKELPEWETPERLVIGAWVASAYPLIDAVVLAKSAVRAPRHRSATTARLGAALDLTNCLSPSESQWDKARKSLPESYLAEVRSVECFAASATILRDALASDLDDEALDRVVQEQTQAMQTACKPEE
jgi:hypothetical protein